MFVLHPGGKAGGGSGTGKSAIAWYFGQLGLYFGAIRMAYAFWAGREARAIEN
jgi:hypothetical protein